uniref:Death domain-containing protein n=1 Tax=Vombatus ursinus TaxID=29139 RepID=A0A4X2KSX9_VOMUR
MNQEVQIFEVLRDLKDAEFQIFKKVVSQQKPEASAWSLPTASREDIAYHLVCSCGPRALSVVAQALDRVPARHLLGKLGEARLEDGTGGQETSISSHTRREPPIGLAEPVVTQRTLMKLAQHVGHEWRELGIMCLGLQLHQLDRLEEDHNGTSIRVFHMFQLWRNQEREKATATRLHQLLSQGSVSISPEALAVLLEGT